MSSLFKKLRCRACGYEKTARTVKTPAPKCTRCHTEMYYSEKWYTSMRVSGKKVTRALSSKKIDANIKRGELLSERESGVIVAGTDLTMSASFDKFIRWIETELSVNNIASGTERYYKQRIENHLRPAFGHIKLRDFSQSALTILDEYRAKRIKDVKPATVNREVAVMKRVLSWAKRSRLLRDNPLTGYTSLPENNERERVLTDDEIGLLMKDLSEKGREKTRLMVIIGLNTGLRIEGAITLKWSEIDFQANEIKKVVKHHRRKGPRVVRIPMTDILRAELLAWKSAQTVKSLGGYVIPSPRNPATHMKTTSNWGFQEALGRCGIKDFHYHDIRHTFATIFLRRTKNLHALCKILGHSPSEAYRMSLRYAHILSDEQHEAMKLFSGGNT